MGFVPLPQCFFILPLPLWPWKFHVGESFLHNHSFLPTVVRKNKASFPCLALPGACRCSVVILLELCDSFSVSSVCLCAVCLLRCVRLSATPWSVACQAPLSVGILQARIPEWVAISYSRGSFRPRDQTHICIGRRFLYH